MSVDFLTRELPLSSINYLPYALQLNYLVEFFRLCPKPVFSQRVELKRWFWATSFARYFASLNTNVINANIEEFRYFATGKIGSLTRTTYHINYRDFLREAFALNKASSQTFALLLAQRSPKSLFDSSAINISVALSHVNRHEFHHIFPKAYLKLAGFNDKLINKHANICLLSAHNNKVIADTKPSIYLAGIKEQLGDDFESVMFSNYINEGRWSN